MFAVLYINVRICKYSYCSSFTCNKAHVPYQKPMRSMHHQHKYEQLSIMSSVLSSDAVAT